MTGKQPRVEMPGRGASPSRTGTCKKCGLELVLDTAGHPYCVTHGRKYEDSPPSREEV